MDIIRRIVGRYPLGRRTQPVALYVVRHDEQLWLAWTHARYGRRGVPGLVNSSYMYTACWDWYGVPISDDQEAERLAANSSFCAAADDEWGRVPGESFLAREAAEQEGSLAQH